MTTSDQPDHPESDEETRVIEPDGETLEAKKEPETEPEIEPEVVLEKRTERVFVGTGLFWGLVFGVVISVAFIILAAQNTVETPVRFLTWEMTTPLIALILVSFLAGVIIDELVGLIYRARRRRILQDREELRTLRDRSTDQRPS